MAAMSKHERVLRDRLNKSVQALDRARDVVKNAQARVEWCAERVSLLEEMLEEADALRAKTGDDAEERDAEAEE